MIGFMVGIVSSMTSGVLVFLLTNQIKENRRIRDNRRNENIIKELTISNAILCLLRVKLIEYHDHYMEIGFAPSYVRDNWELMYQAYHDLGGNGMIKGMNIEFRNLPIINRQGEKNI